MPVIRGEIRAPAAYRYKRYGRSKGEEVDGVDGVGRVGGVDGVGRVDRVGIALKVDSSFSIHRPIRTVGGSRWRRSQSVAQCSHSLPRAVQMSAVADGDAVKVFRSVATRYRERFRCRR